VGSEDIFSRIDSIEPVELDTVAYRHISPGYDPRSGVGARIHGGRWNPPDSYSTLYLALSRQVAAAEWRRAAARQSLALSDFLPRELYEFRVSLRAALDLSSEETRELVGLTLATLTADDPGVCQRIGEAAHYLGREAVVAPSATGRGDIVAVFLDRLLPDSRLEVIRYETWEVEDDAEE
jgi:RES domain-containing protein